MGNRPLRDALIDAGRRTDMTKVREFFFRDCEHINKEFLNMERLPVGKNKKTRYVGRREMLKDECLSAWHTGSRTATRPAAILNVSRNGRSRVLRNGLARCEDWWLAEGRYFEHLLWLKCKNNRCTIDTFTLVGARMYDSAAEMVLADWRSRRTYRSVVWWNPVCKVWPAIVSRSTTIRFCVLGLPSCPGCHLVVLTKAVR